MMHQDVTINYYFWKITLKYLMWKYINCELNYIIFLIDVFLYVFWASNKSKHQY